MNEFLVFIAIFKQHVAIMSSLWGSPSGIRLWGPASWGSTAAAPEPPKERILVFIIFFEQNVAIMSSFWGSAPAKPRQHVGHGAQAKLKQWVNFGD